MGRERGDLVVFYEYVLATMRNVVGVLAGLNRVYVAPDKLKRVGAVVGRMELTPPDAAARLDRAPRPASRAGEGRARRSRRADARARRGAPAGGRHVAGPRRSGRFAPSRAITPAVSRAAPPGTRTACRAATRACRRASSAAAAPRTPRRFARRARGPASPTRAWCPPRRRSDAPEELLGDDPELGSAVLGQTTGSDEPATEDGIDRAGGENADATDRRWPGAAGGSRAT